VQGTLSDKFSDQAVDPVQGNARSIGFAAQGRFGDWLVNWHMGENIGFERQPFRGPLLRGFIGARLSPENPAGFF